MKPSSGCLVEEMEKELELCDVLCQLGLLVVESRQPELSPRGRMEGPHCPTKVQLHRCTTINDLCKKKDMIEREILSLWKNKVPICIEVLMLPACQHGSDMAAYPDMSINSLKGKCLLLEQWRIQEVHKRMSENVVSVHSLFQVVNSYLYFSQLSAWLNKSKGNLPANIAYRICPPGDFCTSTFHKTPELHQFPLGSKNKNSSLAIQVSISTLPRQNDIPLVPCPATHEFSTSEEGDENVEHSYLAAAQYASGDSSANTAATKNDYDEAIQSGDGITFSLTTSARGARYRTNSYCAECDYTLGLSTSTSSSRNTPTNNSPSLDVDEFIRENTNNFSLQQSTTQDTQQLQTTLNQSQYIEDTQLLDTPNSYQNIATRNLPVQQEPQVVQTYVTPETSIHQSVLNASNGTTNTSSIDCIVSESPLPSSGGFINASSQNGTSAQRMLTQSVSFQEMVPSGESLSLSTEATPRSFISNTAEVNEDKDPVVFCVPSDWSNVTNKQNEEDPLASTEYDIHGREENQSELNYARSLKDPIHYHQRFSPEFENGSSDGECSFSEIDNILSRALNTQLSLDSSTNGILGLSKIYGSQNSSNGSTGSSSSIAIQSSPTNSNFNKRSESHCSDFAQSKSPPPNLPKSFQEYRNKWDQEYSNNSHKIEQLQHQSTPNVNKHHHQYVPPIPPSTLPFNGSCNSDTSPNATVTGNADDQCSIIKALTPTKSSRISRRSFPSAPEKLYAMALVTPHRPKAPSLLKAVMGKETTKEQVNSISNGNVAPSKEEQQTFRKNLCKSAAAVFKSSTGLPLQSSPAPIKKKSSRLSFDFDENLVSVKGIKNSLSCVNLDEFHTDKAENEPKKKFYSTSAPASTNSLLGNFEESMLNGRLEPCGVVEGFTVEIGASGQFCPQHMNLPLTAFFFNLSDDNAPSPYLGHVNLDSIGKKGYHVPRQGTIQVTLFNPSKTVVKMFVVMYDLRDMPASCQTFLRQRTLYMPVKGGPNDTPDSPVYLRYLIHLRFASSKSRKIYLHSDIRIIFARDKFEFDSRIANYELRSFTEKPTNPTFSPKR